MDLMTDHELAMEFVDGNADAGEIALTNMGEAHKGLQRVQRAVLARAIAMAREKAGQDPRFMNDSYLTGWYRGLTVLADEIEAEAKGQSQPSP